VAVVKKKEGQPQPHDTAYLSPTSTANLGVDGSSLLSCTVHKNPPESLRKRWVGVRGARPPMNFANFVSQVIAVPRLALGHASGAQIFGLALACGSDSRLFSAHERGGGKPRTARYCAVSWIVLVRLLTRIFDYSAAGQSLPILVSRRYRSWQLTHRNAEHWANCLDAAYQNAWRVERCAAAIPTQIVAR
jgi:hypothetical protein